MNGEQSPELNALREFTARIGGDPLLTQASTGNSSLKLDGRLWIKASGRWMAHAMRDDAFVRLDLAQVRDCLRRDLDPAGRFPGASLETAMHAVMPDRAVIHVHSVDAIAWAVRQDAPACLAPRLDGLRWQWLPYTPSGLPLARQIECFLSRNAAANVFVLGNHGLVAGANTIGDLGRLLENVRCRLAVPSRPARPADYSVLSRICADSHWVLPDDDGVHCLSTDRISREILAKGLIYPCQAMFQGCYSAISPGDPQVRDSSRPFLLVENAGVLLNRSAGPVENAMLSGLARVLQRTAADAPIRYLRDSELAELSPQSLFRYRELAAMSVAGSK